jgi:uncharacterized phage protein (TIGR02220 family)
MARYSVDLTAEEVEQVKAIALSEDRTMASALRCLIRRAIHVGNTLENRVNQRQIDSRSQAKQHRPDPTPARAGTDPEKNKKEKRERKVAPLAITKEILSDLSEYTGKQYKPKLNTKARELIAGLMAKGATVEDFKEVHRKKAAEWKGTEFAQYLRPSTLYGNKFGDYLGQPEQEETMDPAIARVLAAPDANWAKKYDL